MKNYYPEITPYIWQLSDLSNKHYNIETESYIEHNVKRGLRDIDGKGVVTGLTEISDVNSRRILPDGTEVPCNGELRYRGVDIKDLVNGFMKDNRYGFEETIYLLLFSELPTDGELARFKELLGSYRSLPVSFVRDMILKAPGKDLMNIISRCVLALYTYDDNPDDISVANVLRQCLFLISVFPMLSVYAYHSFQHYHNNQSLFIHHPKKELSTAENILSLLREDGKYTNLEAKILDLALVLHAEHGGGNNSTFVTHAVSSTGSDTYAVIASAVGSLKGPQHGGASNKAYGMMKDLREHVSDWTDEKAIKQYLADIINKKAFDHSGLIYGIGHAVYTLSDPRTVVIRKYAEILAKEKGNMDLYNLYLLVEKLAPEVFHEVKKSDKLVCANVDFFAGLVYSMLGIPTELYTPLFACGRIAGWSAHRIEELVSGGRIMRPAFKCVNKRRPYIPSDKRTDII